LIRLPLYAIVSRMKDDFFPVPRPARESSDDYRHLINIVDGLVRVGLFDVAVTGTENILHGGGKIDAYTHYTDWTDVIMAAHAEHKQTGFPERFMTKSDYYEKEFKMGRKVIRLSEIFHDLDGFPVDRGKKKEKSGDIDDSAIEPRKKPDLQAVEYAVTLLSQGHVVAIAPQGESIKDKTLRPKLKKGVGLIAILGNAPIQPKAIVGQTRRIPMAGRDLDLDIDLMGINKALRLKVPNLSFTRRFVVRFGEPIELPLGAEDFNIENLKRSINEQTGQEEIVTPKELLRLAHEVNKQLTPRFYANYEAARQDFKKIYGRAT